jgi:phage terminase small subunit
MKDNTFKKYCLMIDYWFTNGFNGTKSYLNFYPDCDESTARINFSKILTNTNIQEYIEGKQTKVSNEMNITLSKQLKRLDDIVESDCKEADKINAIKEQNKLVALYEEHNRQRGTLNVREKVNINFTNKRK